MAPTQALASHLKATLHERRRGEQKATPSGELPFITISRQAGAGGRSLASAVLAEFEKQDDIAFQGWHSFDEDLCQAIVADPDLNVSLTELLTEDYRTRSEDFVSVLLGKSFQDQVQERIAVTIRRLALVGKAILVGRGGVSITRDLAAGLHVRLVASREARVKRMMEAFDVSEKDAVHRMDEQDRSRARMVKRRFKQDIDDPFALRRGLEHRRGPAGGDRALHRHAAARTLNARPASPRSTARTAHVVAKRRDVSSRRAELAKAACQPTMSAQPGERNACVPIRPRSIQAGSRVVSQLASCSSRSAFIPVHTVHRSPPHRKPVRTGRRVGHPRPGNRSGRASRTAGSCSLAPCERRRSRCSGALSWSAAAPASTGTLRSPTRPRGRARRQLPSRRHSLHTAATAASSC